MLYLCLCLPVCRVTRSAFSLADSLELTLNLFHHHRHHHQRRHPHHRTTVRNTQSTPALVFSQAKRAPCAPERWAEFWRESC